LYRSIGLLDLERWFRRGIGGGVGVGLGCGHTNRVVVFFGVFANGSDSALMPPVGVLMPSEGPRFRFFELGFCRGILVFSCASKRG